MNISVRNRIQSVAGGQKRLYIGDSPPYITYDSLSTSQIGLNRDNVPRIPYKQLYL